MPDRQEARGDWIKSSKGLAKEYIYVYLMDMDNHLVKAKGGEARVGGGGKRRGKGEHVLLCQH